MLAYYHTPLRHCSSLLEVNSSMLWVGGVRVEGCPDEVVEWVGQNGGLQCLVQLYTVVGSSVGWSAERGWWESVPRTRNWWRMKMSFCVHDGLVSGDEWLTQSIGEADKGVIHFNKHNGYLLFCKWRINFPSIDYNAWNKAQIWSWLSWNGLETLRFLQWDTGRGCLCLSPSSPSPAVFSVPLSLGVPDVAGPPSVATQPTICDR